MLKWLKGVLKKWLADEPPAVDALECLVDGRIKRVGVLDSCGMKLLVFDGQGDRLVGPEQAVNRHLFWQAWGQRSNNDMVWDDGSPFRPEET